jgi:hypothetical protein
MRLPADFLTGCRSEKIAHGRTGRRRRPETNAPNRVLIIGNFGE